MMTADDTLAKAGFLIDILSSASDWLIFENIIWLPPSLHQFESPSKPLENIFE